MLICVRLIRIHGGYRLRRVGEMGLYVTGTVGVQYGWSSYHTVVVNPSFFSKLIML